MAWCRQATSHYLSQCWPSSLSPYGVTTPQWVNSLNTGTLLITVRCWYDCVDFLPNSHNRMRSNLDSCCIAVFSVNILRPNAVHVCQWGGDWLSIEKNAFENIVWKISSILARPQFVNVSGIMCRSIDIGLSMQEVKYPVDGYVIASHTILWYHYLSMLKKLFFFSCLQLNVLTHWGRVTHICISKITIIGSDNGLSPWTAPSHYLNQCWNIVNWTLGNKLQWNLNRNLYIFIQENPLENVVWKMAAILSRPQCVNPSGVETRIFLDNLSILAADAPETCRVIYDHGIDHARQTGHCPSWGKIPTNCAISVWRNDRKCKYSFMFP